jgi:hypothetical protein
MATEPVIALTTIDTITAFSGWPHCNNARHPRTVAPCRRAESFLFIAFSSREPVSTSPENALT